MSKSVGVYRKQADMASSTLILRNQGFPAEVVRQRIICGRWRYLIEQVKSGNLVIPDIQFDLTTSQIEDLEAALAETEAEFNSQSELRHEQAEQAREYASLSQRVYNALYSLHRRWHAVRYDGSLDASTRRVRYRAIRLEHRMIAPQIKEVYRARKALDEADLGELVFTNNNRRWLARYKRNDEKFNWPPEVRYRRIIELYEKWLNQKEAAIADFLTSRLDEE